MDFVILKVNGTDVSNSSHEDAVRCFQHAQEPIIVEVLRRQPITSGTMSATTTPSTTTTATTTIPQVTTAPEKQQDEKQELNEEQQQQENGGNTFTLLVSTGVQTDWAGLIDEDDFMPVTLHADEQTNDSFDDILGQEIDFEEVTLRKAGSAEKLGLTVCYSSGSGSEDADTEVYISEIVPESLAARDGRLREGDQILRVNGKDVANKEQTENLFAETKSAVTILVSRCLYPDDEYDDRRIYHEGSPTLSPDGDPPTPAYQNSMIEQLIRQQEQLQLSDEHTPPTSKDSSMDPPPIPSHTPAPPAAALAAFSNPSSTCSSSHSGSQKSGGGEAEQQQRRKWMQEALKECARRVDGMSAGQKLGGKEQVKLVAEYSSHVWSDTEHIYETIPESDSEPIYSSPYEHQHWLHQPNNNHLQGTNQTTTTIGGKPWHSSSKSNSSGEEKDSSSAYNTGESCNSNTLTLELTQQAEHHRSTLVLCAPKPSALVIPPPPPSATSTPKMHCNCSVPVTPSSGKVASKTPNVRRSTQQPQPQQPPAQQPQPQPQTQSGVLAAETMYTNVANLQQTMRLQQQLFKQALISRRKSATTRDSCYTRRSRTTGTTAPVAFQAPNLAQYQFVASHQVAAAPPSSWTQQQQQLKADKQQGYDRGVSETQVQMEWKVKRRADGTRYIARRPVRNRILRNRALRINEERQGHTTEDDAMSEIKVGRYWSKEERKRQLERARERKQRQQELVLQQQQSQQMANEQLISEYIEESKASSKKPPACPGAGDHKKTARKKPLPPVEDFTTVQEMLSHGNRVGANNPNQAGKLMGLLSVTTV